MLFGRKRKIVKKDYDRENRKPILRSSICTGETVAGFRDLQTGRFIEVMLIRGPEDLREFMETYSLSETPPTEY